MSPAFKNFEEGIKEVNTLLQMCLPVDEKVDDLSEQRRITSALCRAAIVLLCSHMEGYFENIVESFLQFHECNNTPHVNLPLSFKVLHLWKYIEVSERVDNETKWHAIQALKSSYIADESGRCVKGTFNLEVVTRGFSSPGSKEVEKLLKTIGIEHIWERIEERSGSRVLQGSLNALVNRRHPIAHGDSSAIATPHDVALYVEDMTNLARICDGVIGDQIALHNSEIRPWDFLEDLQSRPPNTHT